VKSTLEPTREEPEELIVVTVSASSLSTMWTEIVADVLLWWFESPPYCAVRSYDPACVKTWT